MINLFKKDAWMDLRTLPMTETDAAGNKIEKSLTVRKFVELYNIKNALVNQLSVITRALAGELYLIDPGNPYFISEDCGEAFLKVAQKRAEYLKQERGLNGRNTKAKKRIPKRKKAVKKTSRRKVKRT